MEIVNLAPNWQSSIQGYARMLLRQLGARFTRSIFANIFDPFELPKKLNKWGIVSAGSIVILFNSYHKGDKAPLIF